ncbi:MAG: AMP-binding protein [Bacteroidales bacterium]|nr:AMP-binding protein [Bacteroidales bacterium]
MFQSEKKHRDAYVTTLRRLLDYAADRFRELPASGLLDGGQQYTYGQMRRRVEEVSELLSRHGIGAGDRLVIFSQNMPDWTIAFFAVTAYGRVAVPVLADSSATEVANILGHSDAKALFVSAAKWEILKDCPGVSQLLVICLDDFSVTAPPGAPADHSGVVREPAPDDLAGIFYTSGTTGRPKGVMLSHRNLCHNVKAAFAAAPFGKKTRWLSFLPMAHTYEMACSMLYPVYVGARVFYMTKAPTPALLADALARVKPHVVCSVPLVIEKIYRSGIRKKVDQQPALRWMERHMSWLFHRLIGFKLRRLFGGHLRFFGIGGSKVDPEVEKFLFDIHFPYAIGYGLTETAPLITAKSVWQHRYGSIGQHAFGVQVRIADPDAETGFGEIQCQGPNVMLGYYHDEERTKQVFTEDGWFRTGDLGRRDGDGYFYIKGRIDSMFVGPAGENIYPEEIERLINNNIAGVEESVVVNREGRLVALVKLEDSLLQKCQNVAEHYLRVIEEKKKEIMTFVNGCTKKSSHLNAVSVVKRAFDKTATMKIRRFLYQKKNGENEV